MTEQATSFFKLDDGETAVYPKWAEVTAMAFAVFITVSIYFIFVMGVGLTLLMLGLPFFIAFAGEIATIFVWFSYINEIVNDFVIPLYHKTARTLLKIATKLSSAKSWVKGLFSKTETTPEMAAA